MLSKLYLHTYCLGTSVMALMYYTVLSGSHEFTMADIYWRGLCEIRNGMDPKRFCAKAEVLTLTQVTLGMPVLYIAFFYLPTVLYVLIINIKKAPKNVKVPEHVVLFILATFTNMFFTKPQPEDKMDSHAEMKYNPVRSSSLPNITSNMNNMAVKLEHTPKQTSSTESTAKNTKEEETVREQIEKLMEDEDTSEEDEELDEIREITNISSDKLWRRSVSCPSLSFKEKIKESDEPDFSLFHSNIIYFIQFIGFFLIISFTLAIVFRRGTPVYAQHWITIAVLLANFLLWIDLNITMLRKKNRMTGALR